MLLPKGGVTWKSAKARLPPWKAIIMFLTRTRLLVAVALAGLIVLLWRGITVSTREMSKYARRYSVQHDALGGTMEELLLTSDEQ